jgi:hypothetical protein
MEILKCNAEGGESILTAVGKVHGMGDGIVAVDTECHQYVGRCICGHALQKFYNFARHIASLPSHSESPNDVNQHVEHANTQICE